MQTTVSCQWCQGNPGDHGRAGHRLLDVGVGLARERRAGQGLLRTGRLAGRARLRWSRRPQRARLNGDWRG